MPPTPVQSVTLIDGRRVPSDSEEWRAECEARRVAALGDHDAIRAEFDAMRKLKRPEAGIERLRRDVWRLMRALPGKRDACATGTTFVRAGSEG